MTSAPSITREVVAAHLWSLGLRVKEDAASRHVTDLGPAPTTAEVRALGARLIVDSKLGTAMASEIGAIAKQMDRMAQKTDPSGPRIELPPELGTIVTFKVKGRQKKHTLAGDGFSMKPFLHELGELLDRLTWPWRFVIVEAARPAEQFRDERLLLVPTSIVPALVDLAFIAAGTCGVEGREGDARAHLPSLAPVGKKIAPQSSPALRSVAEIVGAARLLVGDAECVDSARDYAAVVAAIVAIADGALSQVKVLSCVEERGVRVLRLALGKKEYEAKLAGNTDWLDLPPLLACMNKLLVAIKARARFYEVREPGWGQEFGVAYASAAQARELEASGLLSRTDK